MARHRRIRAAAMGMVGFVTSLAMTASSGAADVTPQLLWRHHGQQLATPAAAASGHTPLGSVWKLFVYSYLVSTASNEAPYRCEAALRRTDEDYCCDPGESVDRDTALARSCGPYFSPQRLQITEQAWRRHWLTTGTREPVPDWLQTLSAMQPSTVVPTASLLAALQQVPESARQAARSALLPNTLRDGNVLGALGSGPRFKTWSWTNGRGQRSGGAAGWLADGSPFWFGAAGTSRSALAAHATWLAAAWQPSKALSAAPDAAGLQGQPCVDVRLFARYPLAQIVRNDGRTLAEGPLQPGGHTLHFANGQRLALRGQPELRLSRADGHPRLDARLPLEDYVARVVDREGDARDVSAGRALAVAARSWLLQNTSEQGGCRSVNDDSRSQRVSPNPASSAARAAAAFTSGLVLTGADVRYHLTRASTGVMSWARAQQASHAGQGFEAILRQAYPSGSLAGLQQLGDCAPMAQATHWLTRQQARWRSRLQGEAGYESPGAELQVCQLAQGVPFSDQRRLRIHLREWASREGRVTLIHEYLHLAFRNHPKGQDEAFVERLAQTLADS